MKLQIIIGSTRQGRFAERPAQWMFDLASKLEGVEVELVDLRDYKLPYYDEALPPKMLEGKFADENVRKWTAKVAEADGYMILTPEYNHGYPAVLKTALDYPYDEWNNKPVGFVSWGGVGGARVVEQLRQVAIELQMAPIRNAVHIPMNVYMDAVQGKENPFAPLEGNAKAFLDQLVWWMRVLKEGREKSAAQAPRPTVSGHTK